MEYQQSFPHIAVSMSFLKREASSLPAHEGNDASEGLEAGEPAAATKAEPTDLGKISLLPIFRR